MPRSRARRGRPAVEPFYDGPPRKRGAQPGQRSEGRPKSEIIRVTRAARERFEAQLAERIEDVFRALIEAATVDKDTAALKILVDRAVPVRKGIPIAMEIRPMRTPEDCALVYDDLMQAISKGQVTPEEADLIAAIVAKRADLFHALELQNEIAALKVEVAALTGARNGPPTLRVVE